MVEKQELLTQEGYNKLEEELEYLKAVKRKEVAEDKIVAAICAAPETLEGFGVLENKSCTSYPGFVKNRDKVNYIEDELVVVDNNIITSRGPATATLFALEILKELGETKKSEEIKEGMMVKFYNQVIK